MWWRRLASLFVVAAAAFALWHRVVVPWRCNNVEGRVERLTALLWERRDDYAVRAPAERNVRELQECASICETDVNMRMLLASNYTILGRSELAAVMLKQALAHDRRPELHLALGLAQIETGEREAALANFVEAGNFSGLYILRDVTDGELRAKAYEIVGSRQDRAMRSTGQEIRELILNGDFRFGIAGWQLVRRGGAKVTANVERAPAGRPGRALHVVASKPDAGLRHIVNGRPPRRANVSAWVFVRSGSVYLGTGSGSPPLPSTYSKTTGRWEKLEATNESCPARATMIYAASPGGADYYVAEVSSKQTFTALPCVDQ